MHLGWRELWKKSPYFFEVYKGSVFQETTAEASNALARAARGSFYSAFRCCYSLTCMYKVRLTIGLKRLGGYKFGILLSCPVLVGPTKLPFILKIYERKLYDK
jgi:hypothetical protein